MKTKKNPLLYTLIYAILIVQAVVTGYPLIWMVLSSLKDNVSFLSSPWSLPNPPHFENFAIAWKEGIQGYMLNSVFITVLAAVIILLISCAFSFIAARFPFKGSRALVGLFFAGMMIPVHCTLIPLYSLMSNLGWLDKWWTLLLPYVGFGLPLAIFLSYGHYQQIPKDIEEAATIDGCGVFTMFARIFLPLAKPVLSTAGILTVISTWNEFIFANVFISNPRLKTLTVGLMAFKGTYVTNYAAMCAALTLSALPLILVYVLMSNKIQSGMISGAIKS